MRCKFKLTSKTQLEEGYQLNFIVVYANSPDNEKYFKYTPSGTINISLINEDTANKFTPGKEYYLDFIEAL